MWVVVVVVEGRGGGLSHGKRSALEFCLMDDLDFLIEISVTLNNRTEQSKNSLLVTTVDNWFKYRSKVKRQSDRLTEPSAKCDAIRQSVHSSSPLAAAWLTPVFVCLRACLRVCVCFVFFGTVCRHLFGADFPSAPMFGPRTWMNKISASSSLKHCRDSGGVTPRSLLRSHYLRVWIQIAALHRGRCTVKVCDETTALM